MNDKYLIFV